MTKDNNNKKQWFASIVLERLYFVEGNIFIYSKDLSSCSNIKTFDFSTLYTIMSSLMTNRHVKIIGTIEFLKTGMADVETNTLR